MTKESALYNFWNDFGIPAYEENAVFVLEKAPEFPYITYEVQTDSFDGGTLSLSASLWYRSTSWTDINAKKRKISERLGRNGVIISCDNGGIWITRGSPFAQNMGDDTDDMIKRVLINVSAQFITVD